VGITLPTNVYPSKYLDIVRGRNAANKRIPEQIFRHSPWA